MTQLKKLSVFFPTYNDGYILPYFLSRLYSVLPDIAEIYEVIAVNDGSTDKTKEILESLQNYYPHLKAIHHQKNLGYGAALRRGIEASRYEWVFYTDSDGQYDPADLKLLVNNVSPSVDVVQGYKTNRSDNMIRIGTGFLYNALLHHIYAIPTRDVDCDFRLIRNEKLKKVKLTSGSGTICLELVMKLKNANARFTEVAIPHHPRLIGRSKFFRPLPLFNTLKEHIQFRKMVSTGGFEPPTRRL